MNRNLQLGGLLMPGDPRPQHHPYAMLFPMLAEDRRASFRTSLDEQQNHPIVLFKGMILDGRNRERELAELGKPVAYSLFTGDDRAALDFVIAENYERRDLTDHDRVRIASKIVGLKLGDNRFTRHGPPDGGPKLDLSDEVEAPPASPPPLSAAERAAMMRVPLRSVERSDAVDTKGTEELREAADRRDITIATAETIAALPVEDQKAILDALPRDEQGKLTPEAKKEVRRVAKEVRTEDQAEKKRKRDEKEAKLGARIRALPDIKAGLVLSDFEWHFKVFSEETGMDRHASNHYVTAKEASTPEAIVERQRERMQVVADDCIHLMWCPASFNAIALKVMELQGFTYVSQFVWIKPGIGTGFWVRDRHELLLIGVKGKIPCPAMGDQFDSAIEAPKGEHSEKPDFQYEIAEHYFPNLPKVELNARRPRAGWIQWGSEAPDESPLLSDPVVRELLAAHRARKLYPEGHNFAMTNPLVNGRIATVATCSCGAVLSYPGSVFDRIDAAIEAHWQKFDHLPGKVDGRGNQAQQQPETTEAAQ